MRVPWKRVVVIVLGVLLLAGSASATFVVETIGDPEPAGSWRQAFAIYDLYGTATFSHIEVHMDPAVWPDVDVFGTPTSIGNFMGGTGWSQTYQNSLSAPTVVAADGSSTSWLAFALYFPHATPAVSDNMGFQIYAWNGLTQVAHTDVNWLAPSLSFPRGRWTITPLDPIPDMPPIPEPLSMVMLGCVGAGMLAARKISRKSVK